MANSIYKDIRKKHDLTRDEVCDKASLINSPLQPERLERIENDKSGKMKVGIILIDKIDFEDF